MIVLSIFIQFDRKKVLHLTSPPPCKYINNTNQMIANVQVISIRISKLNKIIL